MSRVERLSDLIKARSQTEASIEVFAQATYFPGFIKVWQPHTPIRKLGAGFALTVKSKPKQSSPGLPTEDNLERSLRRTKAKVVAYALCNTYELFATFTFANDRQNVDHCKDRMNNWLKNQKKRTSPSLKYLIVPEFHKDGVSLHFHALLSGYSGKLKPAIHPQTGEQIKKKGREYFTLPAFRLGFTNVKKVGITFEDQQILGRYISKYITKEMPTFKNKNRYWASYGHRLPITENNPPLELLTEPPVWQKSNEYGTISFFPYTGELTEYLNSKSYQYLAGDPEE